MPKNTLACNLASYGKYREAAYEHMASIGLTNVELPLPAPDEVEQAKAKLKQYGLTATTLTGKIEIESDEAGAKFIPTLEAAQACGAKNIFVSVNTGGIDKNIVYGRLQKVGDEAGKRGIVVGMEAHPDLITNGDIALETMKGVNHPNIRVNYDTANVHYYNENIDSVVELKKVIDYVGSMHLKDTNGGYKTWFFPTFGQGIIDFKTVFDLLNERGFYGPFTMEIEGCEGEELNKEETCQRVADSVAYLKQIGCDV